jgi:hypothetical protein
VTITLITVLLLLQYKDLSNTKITYSCYNQSEGTAALILTSALDGGCFTLGETAAQTPIEQGPPYPQGNSHPDAH